MLNAKDSKETLAKLPRIPLTYQSEDDFIQNSGYYDDMKEGITNRLRDTMEDIYNKLSLVKE